jgi:hypothetical protein
MYLSRSSFHVAIKRWWLSVGMCYCGVHPYNSFFVVPMSLCSFFWFCWDIFLTFQSSLKDQHCAPVRSPFSYLIYVAKVKTNVSELVSSSCGLYLIHDSEQSIVTRETSEPQYLSVLLRNSVPLKKEKKLEKFLESLLCALAVDHIVHMDIVSFHCTTILHCKVTRFDLYFLLLMDI